MLTITGIARYPHLNQPDTKFNEAGLYHTKLVVEADVAEEVLAALNPIRDEKAAAVQKDTLKGKKPKLADLPCKPEEDDDGNETGRFIVNCKMIASGKKKDSGKIWERKLPLFDAAGKPIKARIGGASKLTIAVNPEPYYSAKDKEVGVTLRLEAVQVIDLKSGEGPSAGKFGFGKVEGGFEAGADSEKSEGSEGEGDGEKSGGDYNF
jgi:hypothetical protein